MAFDIVTGHGLCGYTGNGLGLADRHVLYPMRRYEYGRAVLIHAYKWRLILCFGRPRTSVRTMFRSHADR